MSSRKSCCKHLSFVLLIIVSITTVSSVFGSVRPVAPEELFISPGQASVVRFTGFTDAAYQVIGLDEQVVLTGTLTQGTLADGSLSVTLPQGFYEIQIDGIRFGLTVLPEFSGSRDPYFAIDGAISWLVGKDSGFRLPLVKTARRIGIDTIRERLRWSEIEPTEGQPNFDGTHSEYEQFRKLCREYEIEVLELIHDAPDWTEKVRVYPTRMSAVGDAWLRIADRFGPTWTALEVWNEPDISFGGNLPADQYMPLLNTIAHRYRTAGVRQPLVGACMATFNRPWLEAAIENGLLDACDVFSFHSYDRANNMATLYSRFWSVVNGTDVNGTDVNSINRQIKPIWITECGRPWKRGKDRANATEDTVSAIDIVAKCIEAKACGCQKYFPFVYPYYDENDNNFGMMDKNLSPMRSIAGYAQLIRTLAHTQYVGDLPLDQLGTSGSSISRARVFMPIDGGSTVEKGGSTVEKGASEADRPAILVLYGVEGVDVPVSIPVPVIGAERVTGERIPVDKAGRLTVPNGFAYVHARTADLATLAVMPEEIKALLRPTAVLEATQNKLGLPLVMRYMFDENVTASSIGYRVKRNAAEALTIAIRLDNLSETAIETVVSITGAKEVLGADSQETVISIPAGATVTVTRTINLAPQFASGLPVPITVIATTPARDNTEQKVVGKLVLSFSGEATLAQLLNRFPNRTALPILDLMKWHASQSSNGTTTLAFNEESTGKVTWRLRTAFTEGDRWTYPTMDMPEDCNLAEYCGVLVYGRCQPGADAVPRFFVYESESAGRGAYFTPNMIFPADGQWHAVYIPFDAMTQCSAAGNDRNNRLDLESVHRISFGGNTKSECFELEIAEVELIAP